MSLRYRLSLIVSLMFLLGMVLGIVYQVSNARQRVAREVDSTARFTHQLLVAALGNSNDTTGSQEVIKLLDSLLTVEESRHLEIILVDQATDTVVSSWQASQDNSVPQWFTAMVTPEPLVLQLPVPAGGEQVLQISTSPADEIEEVWNESLRFMVVLMAGLLSLNGILLVIIGRWFRPVQQIVDGISAVEKGNFSEHLVESSLPELRVIAQRLHDLGRVLGKSKAENERLSRRSLDIQEEERQHMAQELHDELGQSISAIRAIAFSLESHPADNDTASKAGAHQIGEIADTLHSHVRNMMFRLRPPLLDELGLRAALQQMTDDWNRAHADTFCSFQAEGDPEKLDENSRIHLYRIIQEGLTNVSRHAGATRVDVRLEVNDNIRLHIEDDGSGFDTGSEQSGMGLRGMKERAAVLGGTLFIESGDTGTRIRLQV